MKKLLIVFLVTLFFMGCDQDSPVKDTTFEEPSEQGAQQSLGLGWRPDFSIENRAMRPTILGRQKQNPFSVQNMRIALDTVFAYAQEAEDALLQSDLQIGISSLVGTSSLNALSVNAFSLDATDLYVRFLPQDSVGYDLLMQDHTLELFNHPLDYEILQAGDYYVDPSLEGSLYSWQYAVVKPNYQPPQGVIYEILDELFLIENCEGYSEQITGTFRKVLTATSFAFTGNESELRIGSPELAGFITTCKKTCILWGAICWTTCDTRYYPEGYIKVNTPSGEKPLKGIKVRTSRWFKNITMRTDANGYYSTNSAYYDDILIGNCPLYEIVFDGVNGDNSWELNKTWFGSVCVGVNTYGAGTHSPNGYSMTFYTNSDYWGKAVISNAFYDYVNHAKTDGISLPPSRLDVANKKSDDFLAAAPLLKNHIDIALIYASPFWGSIATLFGYALFGWALPDIILPYNKNLDDYNRITATVWHELTHASQLEGMKSEKGYFWASDYWSHVVLQEATNTINTGHPYGDVGDENWQVLALAEGWAFYREWDLARRYLEWNSLRLTDWTSTSPFPTSNSSYRTDLKFPRYYVCMFYDLITIGCSTVEIEKALCAYSIGEFRNKLVAKYPNLSEQITNLITGYE